MMSARLTWSMVWAMVVALTSSIAFAGAHPDFSGKWLLDLAAKESTSLDALLATQGASWIDRKAADNIAVTQTISQTDTTITIRVEGGGNSKVEVLALDGSLQARESERLGRMETRTSWSADGLALLTVTQYVTVDGHKATWTQKRSLSSDGKSLWVDHHVAIDDGRIITAKRVLRKQ